jgi:DnaK suppressor protein
MATRKKLTKTRIKQFREALLEEREQLLSQVEDLDAEADVKRWRDAGFDDDPADSGSASFERETAQSLSRHARHLLTEIDDALRRIDAGPSATASRAGRRSTSSGSTPFPTPACAWTASGGTRRGGR